MTKNFETIKKVYTGVLKLQREAEESDRVIPSAMFASRLDGIYLLATHLLTDRERIKFMKFIQELK